LYVHATLGHPFSCHQAHGVLKGFCARVYSADAPARRCLHTCSNFPERPNWQHSSMRHMLIRFRPQATMHLPYVTSVLAIAWATTSDAQHQHRCIRDGQDTVADMSRCVDGSRLGNQFCQYTRGHYPCCNYAFDKARNVRQAAVRYHSSHMAVVHSTWKVDIG